ncbi:MAG TPA: hypothetical protein VJJ81_01245 [Candidatus Babeliales bacterium]|nr:hypothetical protein [Candidatus Babeliales bacterium]
MKLKSFDKYLATRFSKAKISAIEKRAKLEKKILVKSDNLAVQSDVPGKPK